MEVEEPNGSVVVVDSPELEADSLASDEIDDVLVFLSMHLAVQHYRQVLLDEKLWVDETNQ